MKFTIDMPEEAVNKVLEILAERPFKEVAGIIQGIVAQTQSQARAADAAKQADQAKAAADAKELAALRAAQPTQEA